MEAIRTFFRRHRALAGLLIAAVLCLKAVVPTGFMIGGDMRTITVQICRDASGGAASQQLTIPVKQDAGDAHGKPAKGECPYAALSMASLSGADPVLLALALAFIVALGFAAPRLAPPRREYRLRPPLRGPPALI